MISRRQMLQRSGMVLGAAGAQALAQTPGGVPVTPAPLKFVITGGHPGDPEYGCGGTVAHLTALGHKVTLLYLNNGEWETPAAVRMAEAQKACELLKATPVYAGHKNSDAIVDNTHYESFAKLLLAENPDAVLTHWPIDNHPDHRAIANLTYETWKRAKHAFSLYYYEVSDGEDTMQFPAPTHYIDITATAATKRSACYAHASQSPDRYYGVQDAVAAFRGLSLGAARAEAFVVQMGSPRDILASSGLLTR